MLYRPWHLNGNIYLLSSKAAKTYLLLTSLCLSLSSWVAVGQTHKPINRSMVRPLDHKFSPDIPVLSQLQQFSRVACCQLAEVMDVPSRALVRR